MKTKLVETGFEGLFVVEIDYARDRRGFFIETYNRRDFEDAGLRADFVQDSHSRSINKTLRGLHLQNKQAPLSKLVRCTRSRIFDVAVDMRSESKTFGKWFGVGLNDENNNQLFVPRGFAHGFEVLSDFADVDYKQDGFWSPDAEVTIAWNDADLAIQWPIADPILSEKDKMGMPFSDYLKNPAF